MSRLPTFHGFTLGAAARKSIGKEKTFRIRKSRQDQYPYVVPANPNTPAQQLRRGAFRLAQIAWKALTDPQKEVFNARAVATGKLMGVNLFTKEYLEGYFGP